MERPELAERWTALFAEYEADGLTRKAFCEQRGLKLSTFDYWRRRLRTTEGEPTTVKVATVMAERAIRILVGHAVVLELDGAADAAQIRRVVEAVRGL